MNRDTLKLEYFGTNEAGNFTVMLMNRGDTFKYNVGSEFILSHSRGTRQISITGMVNGTRVSQLYIKEYVNSQGLHVTLLDLVANRGHSSVIVDAVMDMRDWDYIANVASL